MTEPIGRIEPHALGEVFALLEETTEWCRGRLAGASPEAVVWQPFRRSHSIGGLLLHIADTEGRWTEECLMGRSRSEDERSLVRPAEFEAQTNAWPEPSNWPLSEYFEVLDWVRARTLRNLRQVGNGELAFDGPQGRTTVARAMRYLSAYEAFHVGQAALHLLHHDWAGVEPD